MVTEMGVLHFASPCTLHPIWMGHRCAVLDHPTVPANGHSVSKFHRHATELGNPIRIHPMHIWEGLTNFHRSLTPTQSTPPNPETRRAHLSAMNFQGRRSCRRCTQPIVDTNPAQEHPLKGQSQVQTRPQLRPSHPLAGQPQLRMSLPRQLFAFPPSSSYAVHWRYRKQTEIPLGVPNHRIYLREAMTPKDRQVSN